MQSGFVVSLHIAAMAAAPTFAVHEVKAVVGAGLEGDRYFQKAGTFSKKPRLDQQVTLIESEAIEAAKRDHGLDLAPGDSRRNIVSRGVALNHLVGREFRAGAAMLRGIKLCEPCGHLEKLTRAGVKDAFIHRGGLRAEVIAGGAIRVGDTIAIDQA